MVSGFTGDGDCAQTASWLDRKVRATTTAAKEANCFTVNPGNESELRRNERVYTRKGLLWRFAPIVVRNPRFRVLESNLSSPGMLPEIENLLHLQEADKAIRRLQDEIAELPKRVAAIEHKLADTKLQLEKAQAAVKADEAAAASTTLPSPTSGERFPSIAINRLTLKPTSSTKLCCTRSSSRKRNRRHRR